MSDELWQRSAVDQVRLVKTKQASARELLAAHLARIEALNPTLNAIVGLDPEVAHARADAIDQAVANGQRVGPLAGLVTAHKDLADTADFVTTYGSKLFADHRPTEDDPMVARIRAAGAVAVGKTNTPELGLGSHTFNEVYGLTRNPYDPGRSAGGSSGGASVALRSGMVAVADGSDLGGSLRNPAAWGNVVGFRSTARVVSGRVRGNAWNPLAIVGPMARSIDDLVLLLRVMAQPHDADPLSRPIDLPPVLTPPTTPVRVAWSADLGGLPVQPAVAEVLERFRADLDILGWPVTEDEPDLSGADECFVALRAFGMLDWIQLVRPRMDEVKATAREELTRGLALSGTDVAEAYAQLTALWRRAVAFFDRYDLLVAPVTQVVPFPADEEWVTEIEGVPMGSYVDWMRSCTRISTLGCPALSLPAGFTDDGLPVGVQLVGRPRGDAALLAAAKALEAISEHGRRSPAS